MKSSQRTFWDFASSLAISSAKMGQNHPKAETPPDFPLNTYLRLGWGG